MAVRKGRPNGRPTKYSDKLADKICERIASGDPLRSICKSDDMPHRKTVNDWLANPEYTTFCDQYARAHKDYEDDRFEYLAELREKMLAGEIEPAAFREAFNQIRYELGIRRPKKYGEKQTVEHQGNVPLPSFQINLVDGKSAAATKDEPDDDGDE